MKVTRTISKQWTVTTVRMGLFSTQRESHPSSLPSSTPPWTGPSPWNLARRQTNTPHLAIIISLAQQTRLLRRATSPSLLFRACTRTISSDTRQGPPPAPFPRIATTQTVRCTPVTLNPPPPPPQLLTLAVLILTGMPPLTPNVGPPKRQALIQQHQQQRHLFPNPLETSLCPVFWTRSPNWRTATNPPLSSTWRGKLWAVNPDQSYPTYLLCPCWNLLPALCRLLETTFP